jgi:RNA polymerase sigma factor (sigma-70 family)
MASSLFFLTTDSRILDLIRKGDEEALVELYKANRKTIRAYVMRNNGTLDDAEDMLQEALIVLWERVRTGRFEYTAKLGTFIYGVVKNMWSRELARKRREQPVVEDLEFVTANNNPTALDDLIKNEHVDSIRNALNRLGEPCKKLLMLYYWEELSMEEIAEELGFANAETAKSKKYQCKEMLKKLLSDE